MKRFVTIAFIFILVAICIVQQYTIQKYKQSEKEWVELSKLWHEKLDTCMNRNERIYNQLYKFQDIRIKQLKGELPY